MQIIIGVRNFGRIECAEVDINGFSVFVGNNNSGKSYMMQLIYGVRRNLRKYVQDFQSSHLDWIREGVEKGRVVLDADTIKELERFLNESLEDKKEQIVLETFHENITIEELYLKILFDENEQIEYLLWSAGEKEEILKEIDSNLYMDAEHKQKTMNALNTFAGGGDGAALILLVNHMTNAEKKTYGLSINISVEEDYSFHKVMDGIVKLISENPKGLLFLPASRTGLLMLYKEFFAHKADEVMQILGRTICTATRQ